MTISAGYLALLVFAFPTLAEDHPYCLDTTPLAPDGIVIKMGVEYYRSCRFWTDSETRRQFILRINPALVPDLFSTYSPSNLRMMYLHGEKPFTPETHTQVDVRAGYHQIGAVEYEKYVASSLAPNGLNNVTDYVFRGDANLPDIPPHWVLCAGWAGIDEGRSLNCSVWVNVDDITARLWFIGSNERGFEFLDHFPSFAQDIVRVLDVANVTNELDEMTKFLDVIEGPTE